MSVKITYVVQFHISWADSKDGWVDSIFNTVHETPEDALSAVDKLKDTKLNASKFDGVRVVKRIVTDEILVEFLRKADEMVEL